MKAKHSPKPSLRIKCDRTAILRRTTRIVNNIHYNIGIERDEIRRLTDDKVISLLEEGAAPLLRKPQFKALQLHFHVNLLYLFTGLGPEFLNQNQQAK